MNSNCDLTVGPCSCGAWHTEDEIKLNADQRNLNPSNIKKFWCKNPNSKFKGILADKIIAGEQPCSFCFNLDSENCFYPINSTRYELIEDGWEEEEG